TSSGQNDSGTFELNFRDDRYLPFEGAGAIAGWRLTMPDPFRPFDYSTIADVVLHVKYTARDGGALLQRTALHQMVTAVNAIGAANSGFNRLFSLKDEFPTEWYRFTQGTDASDPRTQEFALATRRFPYLFSGPDVTLSIAT